MKNLVAALFVLFAAVSVFAEVKQNPNRVYTQGLIAYVGHDLIKASRLITNAIELGLAGEQLIYGREILRRIKFNNNDAIVIGKYRISANDFLNDFCEECTIRKHGNSNVVKDHFLSELIKRKIMLIAAEDNGQSITEREIEDAIQNTPSFMKDGKFNNNLYVKTLLLSRLTPEKYRESLRINMTEKKLKLNHKDIDDFLDKYKAKISIKINYDIYNDVNCDNARRVNIDELRWVLTGSIK